MVPTELNTLFYVGEAQKLLAANGLKVSADPQVIKWWAMRDSNARPLVPETNALST
jgi:hypothetical protein